MSQRSVDPVEAGLIGDPRSQVNFQQAVRVGEHEQALARIANEGKRAGEGVDYGEPQQRQRGTAAEHKQFLDDNDVRTEDQAEREEASEARPKGDLPQGDPSREPMNKPVSAEKKTPHKAPAGKRK